VSRAARGPLVATLAIAAVVPSGAMADDAPTDPPALEVRVEGERAMPGDGSLDADEVRELPGGLGDAFRAIEVEPGVVPTASGLPYYFVRGAPPGNVGYALDGIPIPLLFHAGAGPSVVPPAFVSGVDLHTGAAPVALGRYAGAFVDAHGRDPATDGWHGAAALRMVDVGGHVEGPAGRDTAVFVGGHYSVGAELLGAIVPSIALRYGDYQAKAHTRVGARDTLTLTAIGAIDTLAIVDRDERGEARDRDVLLDSDFHRIELRHRHEFDGGASFDSAILASLDRSRDVVVSSAKSRGVRGRFAIEHPIVPERVRLRAGLDVAVDAFDVVPSPARPEPCTSEVCDESPLGGQNAADLAETFGALFPDRTDVALGGWIDAIVVLGPRATIIPGVRVDHYTSLRADALALDPRVAARLDVSSRLRLVPAVAVASQPPGFVPLPALVIGGLRGGLQRAAQASLRAELGLDAASLSIGTYRAITFGLTDPIGTGRGVRFDEARFVGRSTGDAFGLELGARALVRRGTTVIASYTLSRATRTSDGLTVPAAFDRTHVATLGLLHELGGGLRVGTRTSFWTGFPAVEAQALTEATNVPRTRPFLRVDVRLAKTWRVDDDGAVSVVLDLQNALLSREVFDVACDAATCRPRELGPITIPTLAVEASF